jgi:hypothetical protein
MLTMTETRETTKHLSANQLRKWARVCKNLRFYYKHGKWKKGTDPESDYCTLCELAGEDDFEMQSRENLCHVCVWKMLENRSCVRWFRSNHLSFSDKLTNITEARLNRLPGFTATRIQMLDKWVRRLNALAATRQF